MNWLELIGLLTVICVAIAMLNEFCKAYEKTQSDIAKNKNEADQFLKEDKERKETQARKDEELKEWEEQNPDLAKHLADEKLRVEKQNADFYAKRKAQSKVELEFERWEDMNHDQRLNLLERLSAFGDPKWVEIYESAKAKVDLDKHV